MDVKLEPPISVEPIEGNESEWEQFLARSVNGTLFHDLRFLGYHPADRFRFHHLILRRSGQPLALVPGGISATSNGPMYSSPLGASIGGPAVAAGLGAQVAQDIIAALQNYAREQTWTGIEITLSPSCYSFETSDLIQFALFTQGFRLAHRWLCPTLRLGAGMKDGYERAFRRRQVTYVRAARRKGMIGLETGLEGLESFLKPFRDTYARHGVDPTHSPDEIRYLLQRLPDKVRIHLAILHGDPVAALLVFRISASVACTFYICSSGDYRGEHGAAFLIAELMDRLSVAGFSYLDFGPSASDRNINKGTMYFKEGLGAVGQCRDRWLWKWE
jgi:hypothetical protein